MRRATLLKVFMLAGLAVASYVVTTRLIQARPAPHPAPVVKGQNSEKKADPAKSILPWEPGPGIVATHRIRPIAVQTDGDTINITGQAFIYETRPNIVYLWSVRILDPDDPTNVLFVKRYDDQRFQIGSAMPPKEPTFSDTLQLPLPEGTYIVELAINTLSPGADLPDLTNAKVAQQVKAARDQQKITITP